MVQMTEDNGYTQLAFTERVSLGLAWDFGLGSRLDLDASMIAYDSEYNELTVVDYCQKVGFGGAIQHSGDNRTGEGEGDDEVINLDFAAIPPKVLRIACVVNCFSKKNLSSAKHAYVRLFMGPYTLGVQQLTKVCKSVGMLFCFLQRNSHGAWFFRTVVEPVSGNTARDSSSEVADILCKIPLF